MGTKATLVYPLDIADPRYKPGYEWFFQRIVFGIGELTSIGMNACGGGGGEVKHKKLFTYNIFDLLKKIKGQAKTSEEFLARTGFTQNIYDAKNQRYHHQYLTQNP